LNGCFLCRSRRPVGATVGLFEKLDRIGGTAAWSGGMVWIPGNPHMAEAGAADGREDALTYLES
jgi:3-oxosteroid 1-dehydrogenase